MSDANKALVRRFYSVFNRGDLDEMESFIREDVIDHNPLPGQSPGLEGLKKVITMFRTAFPDIEIEVEDLVAEGDKVAVRALATGTHEGALMGYPASGQRATVNAIDIWVVKHEKLAAVWHVEELLYLMIQIGVVPPPPGEP
jgi:steroid delta-isomerase-like uncharacterized protein